ncbi:MAG: ABC transporter ATP-binding protein [Planctomycetes bacterium]|jgi:iron complex transport system ATP-binding protein|nr:ABC transporter ATP-binding protein [Planctomycetota bacterium]
MSETVVEVNQVTFCRKQRTILSDVSWRIEKGRHWALLGANGSGKTTLLKLICGYEWPTFGSIHVLGRRFGACDLRHLRKLIGWVSSAMCHQLPGQDTALQVAASGLEASIGLYRTFDTEELDKARRLLSHLGAEHLAEQRYGTLSQGEQQKTLIARALVSEPKLLILDEPCIGLDPASRERFLRDLDEFAARDDAPTMVLVTHHIEEIRPWVDSVLMLKNGQVLAAGQPAELIRSETMGQLFNCHCVVGQGDNGYWLRMEMAG